MTRPRSNTVFSIRKDGGRRNYVAPRFGRGTTTKNRGLVGARPYRAAVSAGTGCKRALEPCISGYKAAAARVDVPSACAPFVCLGLRVFASLALTLFCLPPANPQPTPAPSSSRAFVPSLPLFPIPDAAFLHLYARAPSFWRLLPFLPPGPRRCSRPAPIRSSLSPTHPTPWRRALQRLQTCCDRFCNKERRGGDPQPSFIPRRDTHAHIYPTLNALLFPSVPHIADTFQSLPAVEFAALRSFARIPPVGSAV